MKVELTNISTVKKSLDIQIPQEVVDGEVTSIARQFRRRVQVPGFRPGKAPLGLVKNRYRDDILSEVFQSLLPKYFSDAAKEQDLDIVHAPSYENVDYDIDKPLTFKAVFEVYPQLDVTNHTGIPIEEIPTEVSDAEIHETLERMLEEHAEMTPVEENREIRTGDFVEISFTGSIEGADEDAPDLSAEKALCEIGGKTTLKEFSENLAGLKAGEQKAFDVTYKDDHPDKNLAGKKAHFSVAIESVKEKYRPELDDDFAQSLGDFDKLDDLKANVRENLEQHHQHHANDQIQDAILKWLEENNDFEVPDSLVEHQLQVRLQRLMRDLSQQGINPQGMDVDWGKIRIDQYEQAVRDVRGSLILEHLAERENVDVENEEIEREIETIASQMGRSTGNVREVLTKNEGLDRMKGQIRNKKVLGILQNQVKFVPAGSLSEAEGSEEEQP